MGLVERRQLKIELARFMLSYKFATDEMMTKINILKEEFASIHDYSPIEHVNSRLKSPEGILNKANRKGCPLSLPDIRAQIQDIAGIRITCSFISDIYRIRDMLTRQQDVTVLEVKDYVASPKGNGYKSLHLIVAIPVFMSDRVEPVTVEIQIRTVAMDFWASLEHKIYYKYRGAVPVDLVFDLKQAADVANRLDVKMERLHDQVLALKPAGEADSDLLSITGLSHLALPEGLLEAIGRNRTGVPVAEVTSGVA
ncbi:GTP pyrophosphokinase family protein [Cryobacterium sp. TMT1-21]|uniref:GTP pyrophosphokinase family protein n=2 Tax=Microbacteriaceae TaxID=85023 RepID=A0AAQ2C8P9_9MICO|nr:MULTISPECIES: GTP pyrophosphokinase family protein [Cryobacterium]TFC51789.1 GTP pyrophosphokinase family protein [Cryobacterium shii]TFC86637.1 GTP pyrophosphokinase family protein [Cryobacterium sp. TmT2-59]TFD07890.1 GTP pyrophosphokinase family protein [Cryobacterium sp. TMT1-21]TFD15619.1 GTP pyrophosphokinase family protein [Cryobacterium sp. TMT4-10]TFD28292.1 GTP pyrophosphokinase family protein [Cryobacterium sp. TMT2-23]